METHAYKDPKLDAGYKELLRRVENDRKVRKHMLQKERDRLEQERKYQRQLRRAAQREAAIAEVGKKKMERSRRPSQAR